MSGGQQQRTALARALVKRPKVLLLDEPLGALDLKLRKRMQIELKQLQRELGITFIFVTHDQDEALSLSDSIAVINAGAVMQYGYARDIYDRPSTAFVADFLGKSNILKGRVDSVAGETVTADIAGERFEVAYEGPSPSPGEPVYISIRPEHLSVGSADAAGGLRGTVEDKIFLGTSLVIQVQIPNGPLLSVRGSDRAAFDTLEIGRDVTVRWKPQSARVVQP